MRKPITLILLATLLGGCRPRKADDDGWRILFDGKSLENWTVPQFGGEGESKVIDGAIHVGTGEEISGVAWDGPALPRINYELCLEAKMIDGLDFFCGVGFPVGKEHCSFVIGGWGGGVVGLSSVDGLPASENETASFIEPIIGKWYKVRFRVTTYKIDIWIDDKQVVELEVEITLGADTTVQLVKIVPLVGG